MSRYEITDNGRVITITESNGIFSVLEPTEHGHCIDDASIGAIRQQQADIAELTAERDQLRDADAFSRKELARGNEIIDGLRVERDQLRATLAESMRQQAEEVNRLRARLAAIDAAPTVALTFCHPHSSEDPGQLILRPAKDGGT